MDNDRKQFFHEFLKTKHQFYSSAATTTVSAQNNPISESNSMVYLNIFIVVVRRTGIPENRDRDNSESFEFSFIDS